MVFWQKQIFRCCLRLASLPCLLFPVATAEEEESARKNLAAAGSAIFRDTSLSEPHGVSCMSCHSPQHAFADPRPISPGARRGSHGTRNAPSLMYAALIPNFAQEDLLDEDGSQVWVWQGGHFHDGSARTLHEQISKPFFHPDEMNLASEKDLAARLRRAPYAAQLRRDMSAEAWADDALLAHRAYRALVAFLKEPLFRPFDACIDDFLAGKNDALTAQQIRGLELFRHKGKCADCHHLHASSWPQPLLSDYGYDNLGVPSRGAKDPGLAGHTKAPQELGHFRAPSLRNVALTAPYFHNGSIASLREVVEFYNLRDKQPGRWGKTDYPGTVNHDDLGDLGLTEQEVDDLVSLMEAFTDRTLLRLRERGGTFPEQLPQTPDSWSMRAYFPDWTHDLPPLPAHPPYQGNLFPSTHSSHTP